MTKRVDATDEKDQCKATTRNGSDGVLCCRFVAGHPGPHKTCYVNGSEWTEPFNCAPPTMAGYILPRGPTDE